MRVKARLNLVFFPVTWALGLWGKPDMPEFVPKFPSLRRVTGTAAGLLLAGLLAGCATVDEMNPFKDKDAAAAEGGAESTAGASEASQPSPPASRPQMKPAASLPPGSGDAQPSATVTPTNSAAADNGTASNQVAAVQPSAPITGPAGLIGLDQPSVERHLGIPVIKRESPPAEIWVYDGAECVLNLYFYLNLESQAFETLRYEVVGMGGERPSDRACYDNIVSARG